jgi:hypothetical protein
MSHSPQRHAAHQRLQAALASLACCSCCLTAAADSYPPAAMTFPTPPGGGDQLSGYSMSRAGDVNNDGYEDFVVGAPGYNFFRGAVRVYSGADGSILRTWFGPPATPVEALPGPCDGFPIPTTDFGGLPFELMFGWSVAGIGDLEGDGHTDIVVGMPMFSYVIPISTFPCYAVAWQVGEVYVYSGGTGNLLHKWRGQVSNEMLGWSVAGAGDVNGDDVPDIIVGAPGRVVSGVRGGVYIYSGATFERIHIYDYHHDINGYDDHVIAAGWSVAGAGDLDGDGFDEVILGCPDAATAYVISPINGNVRFYSDAPDTRLGWAVANAGDADGDGVIDILMTSNPYPEPTSPLGYGKIISGATNLLISTWPGTHDVYYGFSAAGIGDFNGDGYDDVAIGSPGDATLDESYGRVEVHCGRTGAPLRIYDGLGPLHAYGETVASIGDMNGDGLSDLLVGAPGDDDQRGVVYGYFGQTNTLGVLDPQNFTTAGPSPAFVLAADLNGDDVTDFVTTSAAANRFSLVLSGDGHYHSGGTYSTGEGPVSVAAADLDHDGDLDLAVATSKDNRVTFHRNNGPGFMTRVGAVRVGRKPWSIVAADFNNDGFDDVAVACKAENRVMVLQHRRYLSFPMHQMFTAPRAHDVGATPIHLAAGDLNNDGKDDVIVANYNGHTLTTLLLCRLGRFTGRRTIATDDHPACVAAGDVNADGLLDVAYVCRSADRVQVRYGSGHGGMLAVRRYVVDVSPRSVIVVDFDDDGFEDLLTCSSASDTISLALNDRTGRFFLPAHFATGENPQWLAHADVDSDHDEDIVTVSPTGPGVSFLLNSWYSP